MRESVGVSLDKVLTGFFISSSPPPRWLKGGRYWGGFVDHRLAVGGLSRCVQRYRAKVALVIVCWTGIFFRWSTRSVDL